MKHKQINILLLSFTLIFLMSVNIFAVDHQSTNSPPSIIEIEGDDGVVSVIESDNKNFDFLMEIALESIKNIAHGDDTHNNGLLGEVSPAAIFCCDPNYRLETWTLNYHDWEHYGSGNNCTVTVSEVVGCAKCGSLWSSKIIGSYRHHHEW